MTAPVLTEQHGGVLLITLNRSEAMKAINEALSKGLVEAIQQLDTDPTLAAGVLTGAGRAARTYHLQTYDRRTVSCVT